MTSVERQSGAPQVTVLMSVYNSEPFLAEAVESILGQTYQDFEFVIIDDGSEDGSREIIERYAARDSRIVVLANETNIGLTRSLNRGLEAARGRYLARQDADDVSLPHRLATQVEYLDSHPATGLLGTGYQIIDARGRILGVQRATRGHEALKAELIVKNNALLHTSVMTRAELVRAVGGYNENFTYAQDYDLWWRMARITELDNCSDVLLKWRESEGSISSMARGKQLACMFKITCAIINSLNFQEPLPEESYSRFWWSYNACSKEALNGADVEALVPLWKLIGGVDHRASRTLEGIRQLALSLIRQGDFATGRALIKALNNVMNVRVGSGKYILNSLIAVVKKIVR